MSSASSNGSHYNSSKSASNILRELKELKQWKKQEEKRKEKASQTLANLEEEIRQLKLREEKNKKKNNSHRSPNLASNASCAHTSHNMVDSHYMDDHCQKLPSRRVHREAKEDKENPKEKRKGSFYELFDKYYKEKKEKEKAKRKEEKERKKNEEEMLDRMDSQKESSTNKHHEKYSSSNDCKSEEKFQNCSKNIILPLSNFDLLSNFISTNHEIEIQKSFDFMDFSFHDLKNCTFNKINISSIIHLSLRYYRRMDMCFLMNSYIKFYSSNYNTLSCINNYFLHMHCMYSVSLGYHIGSFSCHFIILRNKVGFCYVNYHVVFLGFRKSLRLEPYYFFLYPRLSNMHLPLHQSLGIVNFFNFRIDIAICNSQYPLIVLHVAFLEIVNNFRLPFINTIKTTFIYLLLPMSFPLTLSLDVGLQDLFDLRSNPSQAGGDDGKGISNIQEKDVRKEAKGEG